MRFFFFYPTFDRPAGGLKQLRLQASLLRELGVETLLLREQVFFNRPNSFDDNTYYDVPVELATFPFEEAGEHLTADDVLVLPEVMLRDTLPRCAKWRCRIAINNQNGFYGIRDSPPRFLSKQRVEFAIANAPFVADFCHRFYGLPRSHVFLVPLWLDRPPFGAGAVTDPPPQIAVGFMPRKLPDINAAVRDAVGRTHPDVPWVEIDGLPESLVAQRLRKIAVFFAAQDVEGFGLPGIEAMLCGCVVAGFPGTGPFPHPYAKPDNGFWAEDRDAAAAAECVRRAIELAKAGGAEIAAYRDSTARVVRAFTRDEATAALAEMLSVVATRDYAKRSGPKRSLSWRQEAAAIRMFVDSGRLGLLGKAIAAVAWITRPLRKL